MDLPEQDWRSLLKLIRNGKCVLLLGPGAAIDPDDPGGDPLPVKLSLELAKVLHEEGKGDSIVAPHDLAHVAQIYAHEMRRGRCGLELRVEDFYAKYASRTSELHVDLAALPFTLCITTTPDHFMLNAFRQHGKEAVSGFYHFRPDPKRPDAWQTPTLAVTEQRPLVYNLYGSLDETGSLVLTENDLLDFLVNVTRKAPELPAGITSYFSDPDFSFLFVGFGFRNWYVRILLHALKAEGHEAPSLALEDASFFKLPDRELTALFFRTGHRLEFYQVNWLEFARELRKRFGAQAAAFAGKPDAAEMDRGLPADAPTVFLCHENRDKQRAEELGEALQARGIKFWLDKQNLRGGDRWASLISHVLAKQVNYVVVLQSPHMLDKPESYFRREIRDALDRQQSFQEGLLFVIPTIIENDPRLPISELRDLHCIDVTSPEGIDKLAEAIQEDSRKRREMASPAGKAG